MQRIKTKVLAALTVSVCLVVALSQAVAQEAVKNENSGILSRKSIVEHWLSLYARVDAGQRYFIKDSDFSNRPKTKGVIGAGIGYRFSDHPIRLEFDVQNANFRVSSGPNSLLKAGTQTYMLNLYRDFNTPKNPKNITSFTDRLIPYITSGVGTAQYRKISGVGYNTNSSKYTSYSYGPKKRTTWDVGLGIKFYLDRVFAIDIGCKYVDLGSIPTNSNNVKVHGYQANVSILVNSW